MRHRSLRWRASRVPTSLRLTREKALLLALVAAAIWMSWSLVQELALNHQLNEQAAHLRQQNASLQAGNQNDRSDARAVESGSWDQEQARLDGYARPGEKVYIVNTSP
jgi:cell division protein FtsB